mgnify:CR=1 FL=1
MWLESLVLWALLREKKWSPYVLGVRPKAQAWGEAVARERKAEFALGHDAEKAGSVLGVTAGEERNAH